MDSTGYSGNEYDHDSCLMSILLGLDHSQNPQTTSSASQIDQSDSDCDCDDCCKEKEQKIETRNIHERGLVLKATTINGHDVAIQIVQPRGEQVEEPTSLFDKYMKCADFSKCSIEGWSTLDMNVVKAVFAILMGANIIVTLLLNDYVAHVFFFFSYWGDVASFFATCFQIRAAKYPKTYQVPAMICQEMAWCFNLIIFPLFWGFIFWWELKHTDLSTLIGKIDFVHYFTTHTFPLISCIANTYLTKDMTMIRGDWKIMLFSGTFYIFANWLGTIVEGSPMYPIADWTNVPLTIFIYFATACVEAYVYVLITDYINSKRPKK